MDKFNPYHLMFLIWSVAIISMKTYPRVFIENGWRDSWIAVIISSIIIFCLFFYFIKVWKRSEEKNIVKIYQIAFGKTLGNIFMILFMISLFFILIECTAIEADSMHNTMSIETPKWYYSLFFVLPGLFIVSNNLTSIISISVIGIILISIAGMNLGALTSKDKDIRLLLPVFENGLTFNFILCILETLGLYGHISIIFPYLHKIEDKKNRLNRASIIALIYLLQMEIVSTTGILMTFTPQRAISMNYPKLLQTQLVSFYQFFDFGELYVMLQTVGGWILKYCVTFYGMILILKTYGVSKKTLKIFKFAISIAVYFISVFITQNTFLLFNLLDILQYITLITFVAIPISAIVLLDIKMRLNLVSTAD